MVQFTVNKIRLISYSIILVFILLILLMYRATADNRPDYYTNCQDAYTHHDSNIPISSKYYRPQLDRDGNGIACQR